MSKRRDVSGEEDALWREVVRDAKPVRRKKAARLSEQVPAPKKSPPKLTLVEREVRAPVKAPPQPIGGLKAKHTTPIAGVDGGTAERLRRGKIEPDARLDLHGLTQDRAYATLLRFVQRGYDAGHRCVLVITGKGYGKGAAEPSEMRGFVMPERSRGGVLRSLVPHWLEQPDVRRMVVGVQAAHQRHGGTGALYVYLRRQRAR